MAAILRVADAARDAQLDSILALIDAGAGPGVVRIYDGAQPADADDAITTQNLLCEIELDNPAGVVAAGVLTFEPRIGGDAGIAVASGTATWARILDSDDNKVFDANVGETDQSLVINSVDIVVDGPVEIQSLTLGAPAG
jgi:hypothetical protein